MTRCKIFCLYVHNGCSKGMSGVTVSEHEIAKGKKSNLTALKPSFLHYYFALVHKTLTYTVKY